MIVEEDFSIVFIKSMFVVVDSGYVFDDNGVVGFFVGGVENGVGFYYVVNDVGFGDFFGVELFLFV